VERVFIDQVARILQQQRERVEHLGRHFDDFPAPLQPPFAYIQRERAEGVSRGRLGGGGRQATVEHQMLPADDE
jgi:hypothetical protein